MVAADEQSSSSSHSALCASVLKPTACGRNPVVLLGHMCQKYFNKSVNSTLYVCS